MPKAKSYMNPNIPKPKPGDSKGEGRITKPMEPIERREIIPPKKEGRIKRREITPPKKEKRPLPRLISGNPPKKEKRPLPKPINKSGLKKDGPSGKKGSLSMSVKKPVLLSLKKIRGR